MEYLSIGEFAKKIGVTIQIVTVFSCQLQGKRANKAQKMIKELIADDTCQED